MVLFASYSGALGGAERLLLEFSGGLDAECCVACPPGPLDDAARAAGLRVFRLRPHLLSVRGNSRERISALVRLLAHAFELRALVRSLDPELVVAWGMRSAIASMLAWIDGSPIVFQHNDLLPGPLIGAVVRAAAARAGGVITLSQTIADDLDPRRRLGGRLTVVRPGVDLSRFGPSGPPADPPEALVLGALVDWKRPDLALEACALARRALPTLRLRFVGASFAEDGDRLTRTLRERAARPDLAGAVDFAGPLTDPRPALERATCLLHCAPQEPFGLAVLEALAAGRPAVVPASAGPAEIVDESCGILYRPGDAPSAARGLLDVISSPARAAELGAGGRARARIHFDQTAALAAYSEAVTPVIRRPRAPELRVDELALLTVTHNSQSELAALLRSVDRHLPGAHVVVVDCASRDDTVALASGWKGPCSVSTLALGENLGFGRACNRGITNIAEPVTVLVNPDVELLDDSLLALASEAGARHRPERLLAPLVLYPDGSRQDSVHPAPGSPADLVRSLVPPALVRGQAGVALAPWRSAMPRPVGWAVGCALVARTDTLRRLGPFDERIFMYGEDLELGVRAAVAGVQTWFWPQARVLHHRARSTRLAFGGEPFQLLARARRDVVLRSLSPGRARLDDGAQAVMFASRLVLKRVLGRPAERERRQLAAHVRVRRTGARANGAR